MFCAYFSILSKIKYGKLKIVEMIRNDGPLAFYNIFKNENRIKIDKAMILEWVHVQN